MTDRELLELAAKAAEVMVLDDEYGETWRVYYTDPNNGLKRYTRWNPLAHDGQALRLAVKLSMNVESDEFNGDTLVMCNARPCEAFKPIKEPHNDDPCAATRRAIVRAAAEIGRAME